MLLLTPSHLHNVMLSRFGTSEAVFSVAVLAEPSRGCRRLSLPCLFDTRGYCMIVIHSGEIHTKHGIGVKQIRYR